MKRNTIITIILSSLIIITSCFNNLIPSDISIGKEQAQETAKSDANIKIFIPNYLKLSEQNGSRVIAPQTAKIRLSIANKQNNYVQHGELLEIDPGSIVPVENAPADMPGGIWSGTFTALECKIYDPCSLKVELLDQNNRVITQGVNQAEVVVNPFKTAQAVFFTTPEKFNSVSGSLRPGEMRFWRITMMGGYSYKLTLSAEGSYPDIVVFNNDGTFREYYSISNSADGVIVFDPASTNDCYIGVWADNGAVSAYSVAMSYNFSVTNQDFSGNNFNGWSTTASGIGASPPVIVVEGGKSILEFNSSPPMNNGGRVILSRTVNFTEPTALSFSVKTDIGGSAVSTFFKFYIDSTQKSSYDGLGASWNADTVIIPAGTHEIKWVLEKDSGSYYPTRTNKVWLADISFSPDVTAYLNMQPKGPKDTYVGGFSIQFTAKALRSDGSVRSGINGIVYNGIGVNSSTGLFTPPATPGTYTVTASLGGKTVSSDIITVHPYDYLRKPYTNIVTGKTYYGYQGDSGTMSAVLGYVTFTSPAERNISADGFVTLEGESRFSGNFDVFVFKDGDSDLRTYYPLPSGNFRIRIWLRFGPGQYRINVAGQQTFIVTNTCTDMGVNGDPRFFYPSSMVQSDDFRITNLLSDILYGVSNEADKIKIIHDYLVQNTVYDMDSVNGVRKSQDALSVLGTRYHFDPQYEPLGHHFAVCDGYSNAAAALLRATGIETQYILSSGMNHAWNLVYTGGSWKFLDVTWDDPTYTDTGFDLGPSYVSYKYYLLTTMNGVDGDHPGGAVDYSRRIVPIPVIPKMKGMPDGWY